MGKIYPLNERPSCYENTIKLIEKSFQYKAPHSFEKDFTPLIEKGNWKNCFIYVDENENVLAHVGVKEKFLFINGKEHSVSMLGGIAVDEARRGEGIFQELFQDVLAEKRDETAAFILWSDLEKLYNKFGFHLCGSQFEVSSKKASENFEKTKFESLNESDKASVKSLYEKSFSEQYLTPKRADSDWTLLPRSADLFVNRKNGKIIEYYMQNKGQDLPEIIYEYGTEGEWKDFLERLSGKGRLWMGKEFVSTENVQYQFFMSPGNSRDFAQLISSLTNNAFSVRTINVMKQEVYFDFNDETLVLSTEEFLRGVFGPGVFEEIEVPPIFISGLDSI